MPVKTPDNSWLERANRVIAHGALTNSKRSSAFVKGIYPTHLVKGQGCYVYDAWNNRYLDFISGLGTNIIGYGHPKVAEAVQKILGSGPSLSLSNVLEVEVAEKLCLLTGFSKVRFFKTGTEACMAAVRIARSIYDGMEPGFQKYFSKVYTEGYHGWSDPFAKYVQPIYGSILDDEVTKENKFRIQITEPIDLEASDERRHFLEFIENPVNIYDEIITGFRVPENFVYKWWKLKPNIVTLGKALGNGFPISAVLMEDKFAIKNWFCSGTYCGELVGLAACNATLDELSKKKVNDLWYYGGRMLTNINKIVADLGIKLKGYATRAMWDTRDPNVALLMQELCRAGVLIGKAHFFTYAHLEANIEEWFLNILTDTVTKIRQGKVKLDGEIPVEAFQR